MKSFCTYCSQLCAEVQNIVCKQCGIVHCGIGQVMLEHLHHVTDVAVVLGKFCLEPQWVQQVALTDARRDLVHLHNISHQSVS